MGLFTEMLRAGVSVVGMAGRAGARVGEDLAIRMKESRSRAPLRSRLSGVLAPGDHPGDSTGFMDYRGVGLPRDYPGATDAVVCVGEICHPHGSPRTPIWLGWSTLNRHTAVVAPTGSGKTISVIAPWISDAIDAGISVVALDVKGDLLEEVYRIRGGRKIAAPIRQWDISSRRPHSLSWNPLEEVGDENALQALVTALLGEVDTRAENRYFQERDHRWLGGLLKTTITGIPNPTLEMVHALLLDRSTLNRFTKALPEAAVNIGDLVTMPDTDYGLATAGLTNALAWTTHGNARAATESSEFTVQQCLSDGGLTIVGASVGAGLPPRAAAASFIGMLRMEMFRGFTGYRSPTLLVLDEVDKYADRIDLSALLDLARGANVGIVLATQNVDQLGKDDGEVATRLGNCATVIVLPGASDRSARYLSGRLGKHTVETITYSVDARGRRIPTSSVETVDVLGSREIMHPPLGEWTGILYSKPVSSKPFLVDFTREVSDAMPVGERDLGVGLAPVSYEEKSAVISTEEGKPSLTGRGLSIGSKKPEAVEGRPTEETSPRLKGSLLKESK